MEKAHSRIKWENYPSIATPLNETNLNKMDIALDEVDNRVLGLDSAKLDKAVANTMVKDVSFVEATGIFTVTLLDGTTKTFDTKLEKIATNFRYDYDAQKLLIELADGTEQEVDLSSLISNYEFVDGDIIAFSIGDDGKVTANVKDGTVTEDKLQPNFLADVKTEVAKAKSHSNGAYDNAVISSNASQEAKTYRDEAKQYRDEVQAVVDVGIATTEKAGLVKPDGTTIRVDADGTIHADAGTVDYTELENKPTINGVELEGNKTLDELRIASKEKVETLETELAKTTYKVDTVIAHTDLGIKETASGEEIHLTDSAEGKAVEFALFGKARQNTTTGKNLLPYPYAYDTITSNGITYTDIKDGSIQVKGTATANARFRVTEYNGKFILSAGNYIASLKGIIKGSITLAVELYDNGKYVKTYGVMRETEISFEILQADLDSCVEPTLYVYCDVSSSATVDTTLYPMLRLASITDDTWEQPTNGASPNPQFPQPIEVSGASGSVEVKSVGKNFLENTLTSRNANGVDVTVNNDGSMKIGGTNETDGTISFTINPSFVLKKGTYIVNGCENGSNDTVRFIIYTKKDTESVALVIQTNAEKTLILEEDTEMFARLVVGKNAVLNHNVCPMVSLEGGEYEPYKESKAIINGEFAGIKVSSNGNYTDQNGQQWICDEVVKYADGSGAYIQRVKKVIFDGSEDEAWARSGRSENISFYKLQEDIKTNGNDISKPLGMYSNRFIEASANNLIYSNTVGCAYGVAHSKELRLGFGLDSNITTVALLKEWLSNNPTEVIYILGNPITTPLTAEQLAEISTFYPITNISNDFDCGMSVKYNCDSKNYIDNKIALLTTAMINNI